MSDLSDSVSWSEVDALNNAAPPLGWPEGMMPSGVNDAARADRGAMKRSWNKINPVQVITPSGGVYTFTTANPAYPTAYIAGEIYCFHPTAGSVGSDQFQVNGILPKPILKRVGPGAGSFVPIIAQDISASLAAQLIYDAALNAGTGAFVLLNPFVPISGDGAGGVSVPGGLTVASGLTVAGDFITTGSIVANGGTSVYGDLQVTGQLSATGYTSRSGTAGPYQTNAFNLQWAGADGAHLWIDSADQGPLVCAPGGNIVVGGSISAPSINATGQLSTVGSTAGLVFQDRANSSLDWEWYATGGNAHLYNGADRLTIDPSGNLTAANVIANGAINVTGSGTFGGGLTVNGSLGGAVAIRATGGAVQSDIGGTAFYAPNGNVVCQAVNAAGALTVSGTSISSGNIDTPGTITSHNMLQCLTSGSAVAQVNLANGVRSWATSVVADGSFYIWDNSAGAGRFRIATDATITPYGHILPSVDGAYVCGGASLAWNTVEAYNLVTKPCDSASKHDIEPVPAGCLELVRGIQPWTYKLNLNADGGKTHWGFMGPEVRDVIERTGRKFDAVREADGVTSMAYQELIAVLWAAVRELSDKLEAKG